MVGSRAATAVALCLGLAMYNAGCTSRVVEPINVYSGDHLVYAIEGASADEAESTLCAGTAPYLDAYAGALKEIFNVTDDTRIRYGWAPDGVHSVGACESAPNPAGCAGGGNVASSVSVFEHELIHAVRQRGGPRSHTFFEEGLAEYLGGRMPVGPNPKPSTLTDAITELDQGRLFGSDDYALAGHFTSFVLQELGVEPADLRRFESAGPNLLAELAGFLEISESALQEAYLQYRVTNRHAFRDPSISCELALPSGSQFVDGRIRLSDSVDCADSNAIGDLSSRVVEEFSFDVPTNGCYAVDYALDGPEMQAWIEECSRDVDRTVVLLQFPRKLLLTEGLHTVVVETTGAELNRSFSIDLVYEPGTTGDDCL